ncbi:4'-phosphopantetheinyl transferase superfamily protein [compost metagenome]
MIGNDIVDLALAQKESNWERSGFLNKIFTLKEQLLILNAVNADVMVWNLWTRKEAAYKIYNRETGIRGYFPLQLECEFQNQNYGTVVIKDNIYLTETTINNDCIHTIAVAEKAYFRQIKVLDRETKINKRNGIPFLTDKCIKNEIPVSISHHGRFWKGISL